ncbi:hypothetical protein KKG46_00510 [Patescibacteria group bacterium]|nr:hypothetical protein [Patescibacteria group bacterium]
MPTKKTRKAAPKTRKSVKSCGTGTKSGSTCENDLFDGFMTDLTAHKLPVFVLMAAVLGLGALFSLMLGVSAASF